MKMLTDEREDEDTYTIINIVRDGLDLLVNYNNVIIIYDGDFDMLTFYLGCYEETVKAIKSKSNSVELVTHFCGKNRLETHFWLYVEGPSLTLKPYMPNFISGHKHVYITKNETKLNIDRNYIKIIDPSSEEKAKKLKEEKIVVIQLIHRLVEKSDGVKKYTTMIPFKQIYLLD